MFIKLAAPDKNSDEMASVQRIDEILNHPNVKLVDAQGNSIELPPSMYRVLRRIAYCLQREKIIYFLPVGQEGENDGTLS